MRINVIGTAGSGKSTFSKRIAEKLDIPCIEIEELAWKSNWTEATDDELFSELKTNLSSEDWVLDGNYSKTRHIKWKRCQIVVYLDLSFHIIFYRLLRRTLIRIFTGKELWAGNKETFLRQFFTRDSVIWWGFLTFFQKEDITELILRTLNLLISSSSGCILGKKWKILLHTSYTLCRK